LGVKGPYSEVRARGAVQMGTLHGAGSRKRTGLTEDGGRMAESQLSELRNMRVLLEEARLLARDLAYHRRARLEAVLGQALDEVDRQIGELHTS
jgi:hypothetical protein